MKRGLALLLTMGLAIGLVACGGTENSSSTSEGSSTAEVSESSGSSESSEESSSDSSGGHVIGYSCHALSQTFATCINERVQEAIEANGDTLVTTNSERDTDLQISQMEDLIAQQVEAIIMSPSDKEGLYSALKACDEAGIPVINYDSGVTDQDLVAAWISSDHYQLGYIMGEYVAEHMDGGKIAVFRNSTSESLIDRAIGFEDALAEHEEFEVIDCIVVQSDALSLCEDTLQANPDLAGIFSTMEAYTLTITSTLESAGMADQVSVFSVDGAPSDKQGIKEGTIVATSAQSPFEIADTIVEYVYDIIEGKEIPEHDVSIEPWIIDASNVDDYDLNTWQ